MRGLVVGLLALASVAWSGPDVGARDSGIRLPAVREIPRAEAGGDVPRVVVNLTKDGEVRVAGKTVTLAALHDWLHRQCEDYDLLKRKAGRSGYEAAADGARWTKLTALVRADAAAPWGHVQCVLWEVFHRGRFRRADVAVLGPAPGPGEPAGADAAREATLPLHLVVRAPRAAAAKELSLRIAVKPARTEPRTFGGEPVEAAAAVTYDVPGEPGAVGAAALPDVLARLRKTLDEAPGADRTVGELRAGDRIPFRFVVEALDALRAAGLPDVRLARVRPPDESARLVDRLPYPASNAGAAAGEPLDVRLGAPPPAKDDAEDADPSGEDTGDGDASGKDAPPVR